MTVPTIPPRPTRNVQSSDPSKADTPRVPPRPKRTTEVAESRSYNRSPLNDPTFQYKNGHQPASPENPEELPKRPPSVVLPSIGHEGEEYEGIAAYGSPPNEQTKNIAEDLPLHAPKASFPSATAKSRIQNVTRTDSQQAAAVGIGKAVSDVDDTHSTRHEPLALARTTSSQGQRSRPPSIYKDDADEQGIPEIGVQIPLLKSAGDVQAPTPTPGPSAASTPGRPSSARKTAGPDPFTGPPGSYGLHGHGVGLKMSKMQKDWYQKHPKELARETEGEYGPAVAADRKDWHLSSTELNRLVHESAKKAVGEASTAIGTPDEEIGNIAAEEYASRIASPRPSYAQSKSRTGSAQDVHVESPLRKMSFPANDIDPVVRIRHDAVIDSDQEDEPDDVIRVRDARRGSYMSGTAFEPSPNATENRTESVYGDDDSHPILADDEVRKNPIAEFLQPAVTPDPDRLALEMDEARQNAGSRSHSRSGSLQLPVAHLRRPSHGSDSGATGRDSPASGHASGTPLEDVYEHEPLFPEDDEDTRKAKEHHNATRAGKPKRGSFARHQFPSKDVWEDAPSSSMYEATVGTPEQEGGSALQQKSQVPSKTEVPSDAAQKAAQPSEEHTPDSSLSQSFLPDHLARLGGTPKPAVRSGVAADGRPSAAPRFPSRDVWEDSPDYTQLVAEVSVEEEPETRSPVGKKPPIIPERPKPAVPARPARKAGSAGVESVSATSLEKTQSAERAKPVVPPRVAGSKFAALKAGFMSDLNNRLQLGPQAPKKAGADEPGPAANEEPPVEKAAPLVDARKSRARGPQRRRPGPSPGAGVAAEVAPVRPVSFSFTPVITLFQIHGDGKVEPVTVETGAATVGTAHERPTAVQDLAASTAAQEKPAATAAPTETAQENQAKAKDGVPPESDQEATEETKDMVEGTVMDQNTQTGMIEVESEKDKVTILQGADAETGEDVVIQAVKTEGNEAA